MTVPGRVGTARVAARTIKDFPMSCRPIVLGQNDVHILRAPSRAASGGPARTKARDGKGRFEACGTTARTVRDASASGPSG